MDGIALKLARLKREAEREWRREWRRKLRQSIARGGMSGTARIEQSDYAVEDFQFAFGAIDCVHWRAIPPAGPRWRRSSGARIEVSVLDRYEFHPEDNSRPTQCVHAAAVEMKLRGAADYWQRGSAQVPYASL